jgi:hypothetical protein
MVRVLILKMAVESHMKTIVDTYKGWPKSHVPEKKLNNFITAREKKLIFLSVIEACSSFISIKTGPARPFVENLFFPYL